MKTFVLALLLSIAACSSQSGSTSTPECTKLLGTDWGKGFGVEVESSSNLDSDRCLQFGDVWCCAL